MILFMLVTINLSPSYQRSIHIDIALEE